MKATKKNKNIAKKVWRITDWEAIYELTDDVRKKRPGPLTYTKSQVTISGLSKAEEVRHYEMMKELKARPERHLLRSILQDLTNWTGAKHFGPRGFLITTDGKSARYDYIAAQLEHLDVDELKKAMRILSEIGLIERVTLNGELISGPKRIGPDESGRKHKPLKKDKRTSGSKKKSPNRTKAKKSSGNDKSLRAKDKRQTANSHKSNVLKGQTEYQTTTPPTTTPPFMPKASDAEGSLIKFTAPPGSVKHNRSGPQKLGDIIAGMEHRYHQDAKEFGYEIYRALKLRWEPTSPQGRRELGCFASMWMKAKRTNISSQALNELRDRAIHEAQKLGRKRQKRGNISAIWCTIFNRILDSKCSKTKCKAM